MSSFYGDTTRLPMTPFQFDKIYTSKEEMDNNAKTDGIFLNRYILLQKKNNNGETYGEVYQKQCDESGNYYYKLIASLTAPFTVGAINTDFNISYDYKETNQGTSSTPNNANWVTNDSQNYLLNLSVPELGNALIDIYNALAGLNTLPGNEREFNIIELDNGAPLDGTALHNYPYHLAHEVGIYYVIMPKFIPIDDVNNEEYFNAYRQNNIPIFLNDTNELYFGNYDVSKKYYTYSANVSDNPDLVPLTDFSNNIYGLIGYLNKLKDGNYPYDRTSLQGCINYANQIINQIKMLTNLEDIALSYNITNSYGRVSLEQNLSCSIISDGVEENKDASDQVYFYGYNGILIEGVPATKDIQIKIPKQNYTIYNKASAMGSQICPINYSLTYTPLSQNQTTKKVFEIYGCYILEEDNLLTSWVTGRKEQISINSLLNKRLNYPIQAKNINIEYFSTSTSGKEYLYNISSYIKDNVLNFVRTDSSRYDLDEDSSVNYGDIYMYFHIKGTCEEG